MKIKLFLSTLVVAGCFMASCQNNSSEQNKTATEQSGDTNQALLRPVFDSVKVTWTAYKTTDKVPVAGTFNKVELRDINAGATLEEALNHLTFSIDAHELSTGDEDRDGKIRTSFFGKMVQPGNITGALLYANQEWFVKLKMNGVTVDRLPATITFDHHVARLKTTINLKDFSALKALKALNEACYDLHKGSDGVSKTWDVVDVEAELPFQ